LTVRGSRPVPSFAHISTHCYDIEREPIVGRPHRTGDSMLALSKVAATVAILISAMVTTSVAQENNKKPAAPNPIGASNPGWTGTVTPEQPTGPFMSEQQAAAVRKVSAYFNELQNLKGTFLQTDPDRKQLKGRFYVKRPGRFRFDYSAPSKKVIISDGRWLAIQDHDLNNEDVFELDNTPFRLLLRNDVDLLRDARILDVQEAEDLIIVTLQDKSPDAPGRITLFLTKQPALDLKEWVTIDAQGLETRIELANLVKTEDIDAALFKRESLALKKLQR
jgi:outer membrane lipoprotein-sorting protein